jgi:hypothetical protein
MGAVSESLVIMNNIGQIIILGIGIIFTVGIVCTFISLFEKEEVVAPAKEPIYNDKYFDNDDGTVIIIEQDEATDAINNYYS